jgi:menaquinol-cytochrome c reductase iron-sulfur subunit
MDKSSSAEEEGKTRRGFLKISTAVLGSVVAVALGIPLIGTLVGTIYRMKKLRWTGVAQVESLPLEQPVKLSWMDQKADEFIRERVERDVWAVKRSPAEVTVFSPICTHLGCRYNWHPDRHEFVCPCHGSIFSTTGEVLGGPAPRSLDTLPEKIENGELSVEWEMFQVGIREKISTS